MSRLKKFVLLLSALFIVISSVYSQNEKIRVTTVTASEKEIVVRADFPDFEISSVEVNGETMQKLFMPDACPLLNAGEPELLQKSVSLIVPEHSRPVVEVMSSEYEIMPDVNLVPSKGKLYRNVDPSDIPYKKGAVYQKDCFLYGDSVEVQKPYVLRDYSGVSVRLFPFAYNPLRRQLKVCKSITLKVTYNSKNHIKPVPVVPAVFDAVYKEHFLNYETVSAGSMTESGEILVVSPAEFLAALQPYVQWKTRCGYKVTAVSLETAGNTANAVKAYISNYYNRHRPAFLLLVGDDSKFPVLTVGGNTSDNCYGELAGDDVYPDVIVGKISAVTADQVRTQVERFVDYERNPSDTAHFPVFCGIASSEGPGDNNEYDYDHIRNIGNVLSAYTYTSGYELFDGSHGGMDAAGDPAPAHVTTALNGGVGIVNYCGHGVYTGWSTTGFSSAHVRQLDNAGKLPFIISVACQNGDYVGRTCFAEEWLRAERNGSPVGAVGALMSTINQPWISPMYAQDRMMQHLTGTNGSFQSETLGGIIFNGIADMLDHYNDYEVSRTWVLFGDPTLRVRTSAPQTLDVTHASQISAGLSSVDFTSLAEGARVSVVKGDELVATGVVRGGNVTLDISAFPVDIDTLDVVAVASGYLPYEGTISRTSVQGPYIFCSSLEPDSSRMAVYGTRVTLKAAFRNIGNNGATRIQTRLRTEDPYLTVVDSSLTLLRLDSGSTSERHAAYTISVASNAPAAHEAKLTVRTAFEGTVVERTFTITLHAPALTVESCTFNDAASDNPNGRFDFGETGQLQLSLVNQGNYEAPAGNLRINSMDGKILLTEQDFLVATIGVGEKSVVEVTATASPEVTSPTYARLKAVYTAGSITSEKVFSVRVGALVENWESGDFSAFAWNTSGSKAWTVTDRNVYEGSYAVRSAAIGNNATSNLSITVSTNVPDTLSFYYWVSSEEDYDFLIFKVDGEEKGKWSGNTGWQRFACVLPAGQHLIKWTYEKDAYYSEGSDMAMLDMIEFPLPDAATGIPENSAGTLYLSPNPTTGITYLCAESSVPLNGSEYRLFDVGGRLLLQGVVESTRQQFAFDGLKAGIYLLEVTDNDKNIQILKLIKQ